MLDAEAVLYFAIIGVVLTMKALENDELVREAPAIVGCKTPSR